MRSPRHGVTLSHVPNRDETPPACFYRFFHTFAITCYLARPPSFSARFGHQSISVRYFSRLHPLFTALSPLFSEISYPSNLQEATFSTFQAWYDYYTGQRESPSLKLLGIVGSLTFVVRFLSTSSCRLAACNSFCRAPTLRALEALSSASSACTLTRSRRSTSSICPVSWRSCCEKNQKKKRLI